VSPFESCINAPINVKPQGGGGQSRGFKADPWVGTLNIHGAPIIELSGKKLLSGLKFVIHWLPWGREFDSSFPKNVKFPGGSTPSPPPWGLTLIGA